MIPDEVIVSCPPIQLQAVCYGSRRLIQLQRYCSQPLIQLQHYCSRPLIQPQAVPYCCRRCSSYRCPSRELLVAQVVGRPLRIAGRQKCVWVYLAGQV